MRVPIVAIVGQPNTGKSSLFNRMINKRYAVTSEKAGTTRDRIYHVVKTPVTDFILVDTGGLETEACHSMDEDVKKQAKLALEEADVILFTIDSKQEQLTSTDYFVADLLRKKLPKKTSIILVLTKCDSCSEDHDRFVDVFQFGFGEPVMVSAHHKFGIEVLQDKILKELQAKGYEERRQEEGESEIPRIAVVGRPNVGKSSLVNTLLNKEQLIVSEVAGTTRDAVDMLVTHDQKKYNFIDTAGLRRRSKVKEDIEHYSVLRSLQAVYRADVVLLVLDSDQDIGKQDQRIAGEIMDQKKGLILVVNKWDLMEKGEAARAKFLRKLRYKFSFLSWASVVFMSAKTKKGVSNIFAYIDTVLDERTKRISTGVMNQFLKQVVSKHPPSGTKRVFPRIYYVTQVDVSPPFFIFFVNDAKAFHFSYRRYIENRLREVFGFKGTAMKVEFRQRERD